ncbi:hypothetical protein FB451DRAFT_1191316 [Mycena latifolia]|nr:hypothetical protein FB451DRAFT_1191316 [Mycena latifolia]
MDGSDFFLGFRRLLNAVILPHMPDRPGEVKGVSATFSLDVRIAGRKQRLNISFDVVTVGWYDIYMKEDIETLYREFVARIGPELTYNSEAWACIECGGPATDSAWMSLYNPKLHNRGTLLVYKVCEKCAPKIQRYLLKLGIQNTEPGGTSKTVYDSIPKPDGMRGVLSGACLTSRTAVNAAPGFSMSRCSKCRLVRISTASEFTAFRPPVDTDVATMMLLGLPLATFVDGGRQGSWLRHRHTFGYDDVAESTSRSHAVSTSVSIGLPWTS